MVTTFRAAVSVLMLAGFYVVALAGIAALGGIAFFAFRNGSAAVGAKVAFIAVIAMVGLLVALWKVVRARPEPPEGLVIEPHDAPELWATVRSLADAAGTRAPDEIRLVPDLNAAVDEDARLLGLVGGRRRLLLGVPLLVGLDVAQLRSVLGHELGHYSHHHTRLSAVTYRGRTAIGATIVQLQGNIIGWLLRRYATLYALVSASVTRQQELEADAISVRVAGRDAAQSALREIAVLDAAWAFYQERYLEAGWARGLAPVPEEFFAGFTRLLAARADELADVRQSPPPDEASRWDTHPSIAARIAHMETLPDVAVVRDSRPATALLPHMPEAATRLAGDVVAYGDRRRVRWEELTASSLAWQLQEDADVSYRAVARVTGVPRATVGTVLDLLDSGRRADLERAMGIVNDVSADLRAPGETKPGTPSSPLALALLILLQAAVVQAGAASWRHSWAGPADLVTRDGQVLDLLDAAEGAARGRTGPARDRLTALGVTIHATGQVSERASVAGAAVLGGLASAKVDGRWSDVIILDRGLVVLPAPKKTEGGGARLATLLHQQSPERLAQVHGLLAYEDVATARVVRRVPAKVELTLHDGRTVTIHHPLAAEELTRDSAVTLLGIVEELGSVPSVVS